MTDQPFTEPRIQPGDYPYFRRTWNRVVSMLLAASFIPLILIGGGMYFYSSRALKQEMLSALQFEVATHKKDIDSFFRERVLDVEMLSENLDLSSLIQPGSIEKVYASLRKRMDCFQDLGIIDAEGRHLAYTGPYELSDKNYRDAFWFKEVMERGVYISDVYLGHRNIPHFIIAVKRMSSGKTWLMRATVDIDYFNTLVTGFAATRGGDAYLLNAEGVFQSAPRSAGTLMGRSDLAVPAPFEGVELREQNGRIKAMVWLAAVNWLCVVTVDKSEVLSNLDRLRYLGIFAFGLGGVLIVIAVLLTTNSLVSRLETNRRNIRVLDDRLRQANRFTSSMEMASGSLTQVHDGLANIDVIAKWVEELSATGQERATAPSDLRESVGSIRSEIQRCWQALEKILSVTRFSGPLIMHIDINSMLDSVLEPLDEELRSSRITVVKDYDGRLPNVRSDSSRLRQVFENLLLNALHAVGSDGRITLHTRSDLHNVSVTVSDNGPGITEENLTRIFEPLFTTRADGLGLGLSVCVDSLEKIGGHVTVKSRLDEGTSFTVTLPFDIKAKVN